MPMLIPYVDEISAATKRASVTIQFNKPGGNAFIPPEEDGVRQYILSWLVDQGIEFQPCGLPSSSGRMEGYAGQVYVDVPCDEANLKFGKLRDLLHYPDGTPRVLGVRLVCYPYPSELDS